MTRDATIIRAARTLSREAGRLRFGAPVRFVYNPLEYARAAHELYLHRYAATRKRVVLVGMNPGPWGMAQTGVPFGEVTLTRDWLGIHAEVKRPRAEHPRVPVLGNACRRSEVSGRRLWGLMRGQFPSAALFARQFFVGNYCPLLFLDGAGRNITPDKLAPEDRAALYPVCDRFLSVVIITLRPELLVGVGAFAERRIRAVLEGFPGERPRVVLLTHPSPANPRANRDWAAQARSLFEREGVW